MWFEILSLMMLLNSECFSGVETFSCSPSLRPCLLHALFSLFSELSQLPVKASCFSLFAHACTASNLPFILIFAFFFFFFQMFSWTFPLSLGCSCKETSGCRITLRQPKRGRDAASLEIPREICGTVGNPQHLYQLLLPLCLLLLHLLPPCLLQLFALSPAPLALRDEVDNPSWPHQGARGVRCWREGH